MSYQIKSTPFFQRMISTCKKNGQLKRLREEYDRIQEFNERSIEMKMRQVRLKRLFREIEEIKDTRTAVPKRRQQGGASMPPQQVRTPQLERIETLARAKELGKEMSRRNAIEYAGKSAGPSGGGGGVSSGFVAYQFRRSGGQSVSTRSLAASEARRQAIERRERTAKRINYGNAQSKCNMQKIGQRRQRNQQSNTSIDRTSEIADDDKRSKLQQRLAYGNARSTCNMARTLRRGNTKAALLPTTRRLKAAATVENKTSQSGFTDVFEEPSMPSIMSLSSDEQACCMAEDQQHTPMADAQHDSLEFRRKKTDFLQPEMHKFALIARPNDAAQRHWRCILNTLPWFRVFRRYDKKQNEATTTGASLTELPTAVGSSNHSLTTGDKMLSVDNDSSSNYEELFDSTTMLDTSDPQIKAWHHAVQQAQAPSTESLHLATAEMEPGVFEILRPSHSTVEFHN